MRTMQINIAYLAAQRSFCGLAILFLRPTDRERSFSSKQQQTQHLHIWPFVGLPNPLTGRAAERLVEHAARWLRFAREREAMSRRRLCCLSTLTNLYAFISFSLAFFHFLIYPLHKGLRGSHWLRLKYGRFIRRLNI